MTTNFPTNYRSSNPDIISRSSNLLEPKNVWDRLVLPEEAQKFFLFLYKSTTGTLILKQKDKRSVRI